MGDDGRERLRAAVHARLAAVSGVDDLDDLMTPEATAEIQRLLSLAPGDDIHSQHPLGWALYYRSLFPLTSGATDRELAVLMFVRCLLAGVDASDIPADLLDEVVNEAGRHSTPLLREASRTRDPSSVENVLLLWRRIAAACRDAHPHRPVILNNLASVLQLRGTAEDDREVVRLLEQAIDATPEDAEVRPLRLYNLGVARRRLFDHTGDEADLEEAITYFQRSLELSPEDDPDRRETYAALGEAYRAGASRMMVDLLGTAEKLRAQKSEAVYAVCELITGRDIEAKERTTGRFPQLRDPIALSVFDDLIEDATTLGEDAPFSVPFLNAHRKLVAGLQETASTEETFTTEPPKFVPPGPVPTEVAEARALLTDGRVEEADALLTRTAEQAHSDDDAHTEGHAELALHDLVFDSLHPAPGSIDRLARHAAAAQEAFHRAGNRDGLTSALRRRLAVAVHFQDAPMANDLMQRLIVLDPFGGVWWHAYLKAIGSDDLDYRRAQLKWCVDHAWRLDQDAAHYRALCERKLAFLNGHAVAEESTLPADLAALVEGVEMHGPTGGDGERLEAALQRVEVVRSHAQSVTVQRALSAVYTRAYQALSRCFAADASNPGAVEASVDVLERNSSRALLVQMDDGASLHALGDAPSDSLHLNMQVNAYIREPTPHHRKLLTLAFDAWREKERRAQRSVMRRVAGPFQGPAPIRVEGLRALLGDDAALFFGATGRVSLITADECAPVGAFEPGALDRDADALRRKLSEGVPPAAAGSLPVLDELIPQVLDRVAEGSRLFVVPSGRLWLVPLAVLGEPRLSDVYEVSTVPSLSVLARLLRPRPAPEPAERAVMVGLADPDGSLPHARGEVEAAAAHYPRALVRAGGDATVETYRTAVAGADVIHLACHGFYLPDHPDFSGLRLAGPRGGPGMLWYSDVSRTRLAASLVVLGACHAGTGEVLSGSEYTGMPGALLAAGARSVLAPLWAVDDRVTARLLESFHASYADTGSAASALREAQRASGTDTTDTAGSVHAFQLFGVS